MTKRTTSSDETEKSVSRKSRNDSYRSKHRCERSREIKPVIVDGSVNSESNAYKIDRRNSFITGLPASDVHE